MPYTANPVWSLPVNWEQGVLERLEWKTDVMTSELGWEQRVPRRLYPRRTFEASFLLHKEDRQYFNILASVSAGKELVIPIWHDVVETTAIAYAGGDTLTVDTRFREFEVGGLAFVRGPNARVFEVSVIEAVTLTSVKLISNLAYTWPKGTRVYPAKLGRFDSDIKSVKKTDQLALLQAAFRLTTPSTVASAWSPSYKELPVLRQRPEDSEDQEYDYSRVMSMLDNTIGKASYYDIRGGPVLRQTHAWGVVGAAAQYELRKLLYNLKGRAKALWLPTFMSDMTVVGDIGSADSFIDITNIGITDNDAIFDGRKDIRIELRDGSIYHREITAHVALSSSVERIGLNDALGREISASEVRSVSYMMVARLDQDSIELNHVTDSRGLTTCRLNFFGPTQGTPLGIPIYTSKPYPVDLLDALETEGAWTNGVMWAMELHAFDVTPSLVSLSMPTVVSYRSYEFEEALDVDVSMVGMTMPTVVAYRGYNYIEAFDVSVAMVSMEMVTYPINPYDMETEALDVAISLVGVTMS